MITSLICHGTLTRFPKLRIASVENGSAWINPLFHDLGDITTRCRRTSPSIRSRCSAATSGSARSGRVRLPTSCKRRMGQGDVRLGLAASRRPGRAQAVLAVRRGHGHAVAPTTSWATTPVASWGCRSPTPTRRPSSRLPWRTPESRCVSTDDLAVPDARPAISLSSVASRKANWIGELAIDWLHQPHWPQVQDRRATARAGPDRRLTRYGWQRSDRRTSMTRDFELAG